MTLSLKIYHAMATLQKARDMLEDCARATDNAIEEENLFDWSDDMTSLLATLERTYGNLPDQAA